jgi:hypothetical protein
MASANSSINSPNVHDELSSFVSVLARSLHGKQGAGKSLLPLIFEHLA